MAFNKDKMSQLTFFKSPSYPDTYKNAIRYFNFKKGCSLMLRAKGFFT